MQPGWCQPVRQEFMENECEALPGVAYPGARDNRSTINTKTGYDDMMRGVVRISLLARQWVLALGTRQTRILAATRHISRREFLQTALYSTELR